MSWKTFLIKTDNKFKIKNGFLELINLNTEEKSRISLEEIDLILIENIKSILTVQTILELSNRNITLIISDSKHIPTSFLLPISTHHKPLQNFNYQMNLNFRSKAILHKQIIKQKIINQKIVLEDLNVSEQILEKFDLFIKDINQGDKTNREAVAAKYFFKEIYGSSFLRFNDDGINAFINFGYKILASKISNSLVKFGLNPALGLFHSNLTNYFNLSYDFIEPFRPLVDWLCNYLVIDINDELTIPIKLKILRILDMKVFLNNKIYKIRNAIDESIKSYVSYLKNEQDELFLPKIYLNEIKEQIENGEFEEFKF